MSQLQSPQLNKLSVAFGKFNIFISKCELRLKMLDIYPTYLMAIQLKCHFSWDGIQLFIKTNKSDNDFNEICKLICKECDFNFDRCKITNSSLSEMLEANIDIIVKSNKLEFIDSYSDYAYSPITTATSDFIDTNIDYISSSNVANLNKISYTDLNSLNVATYNTLADKNIEAGEPVYYNNSNTITTDPVEPVKPKVEPEAPKIDPKDRFDLLDLD